MHSDYFGSKYDMVSYPAEIRMYIDWLIQYSKLLKTSPKTIELLRSRQEEFELVPIPKDLFKQFSMQIDIGHLTDFGVSEFMPTDIKTIRELLKEPKEYIKENVEGLEIARHFNTLAELVRGFGENLEKGNLEKMMEFISDDYRDYNGRTRKELQKSLSELLEVSPSRKIIFTKAEEMHVIGCNIVATVTGSWEANIKEKTGPSLKSEPFKLEIIFSRKREKWVISSIRHL